MTDMTPSVVVELLDLMESGGAKVWIDGGWGVDALLGEQTRPHTDVDIVVSDRDLGGVVEALEAAGFERVPTKDDKPWNFVLRDAESREVDIHMVVFDAEGNGIYGPAGGGDTYAAESLTGRGEIGGRAVRCISPEWQVRFHSGYEWDENDRRDMDALADRFGLEIPIDPLERKW